MPPLTLQQHHTGPYVALCCRNVKRCRATAEERQSLQATSDGDIESGASLDEGRNGGRAAREGSEVKGRKAAVGGGIDVPCRT